jgi:uncharacterized protein YgbK (DUF1537 family)
MAERIKLLVLDDDPTGSQTVHGCPLLLRWDQGSLREGLRHPSPLLFVLANTRALSPQAAQARVQEICRALKAALASEGIARWLIVSRGDSTLRGHFPLELETIRSELGPFAGALLAPAFLPGGRTTASGVHLLHGEPVHLSAFAQDRLFGFSTSFLPAWVEQKTAGAMPAASVSLIALQELDQAAASPDGARVLQQRLAALQSGSLACVDAEQPSQLEALGQALWALEAKGQRLLLQSAASLINGLVPLPPQPLDAPGLARLRRCGLPGLVLVGSHVPLADQQLQALLQEPSCSGLELDVRKIARVLEGPAPRELVGSLEQTWQQELEDLLAAGQTPVLFTSRGELACRSEAERRQLGLAVAALMARLAGGLAPRLGYLISKGGITTHTLLEQGLELGWVELQGQLFAGLSVVLSPQGLPVVTFPGNLGDADSLRQAYLLMQQG